MIKNVGSTQKPRMKLLFFPNWPEELCFVVFNGWREFWVGMELSPVRLA